MGSATEMYFYGTKYIFICLGMILGVIPAVYLFLPVFHEMKVSSAYEVGPIKCFQENFIRRIFISVFREEIR